MAKKKPLDVSIIARDPKLIPAILKDDVNIGLDIETTGLNAFRDNIATIQLCGEISQIPIVVQCLDGIVPQEIVDLIESGRRFIGHNLSAFDLLFINQANIDWEKSEWIDTLTGECVISTTGRRDVRKNLQATLHRRLSVDIKKDLEHGHWQEELTEDQLNYAASDVMHLCDLYRAQLNKAVMQEQEKAYQMEMLTAEIAARMTCNGLPMPVKAINEWRKSYEDKIAFLNTLVIKELGQINIKSPAQVKKALNERFNIQLPNTNEAALRNAIAITDNVEFAELLGAVLDLRSAVKRVTMYDERWQNAHVVNDWIHPRFWVVGTDTTRFSSSNPNAQQFPREGRCMIGNMPGYAIVSIDYSQIEIRIAAYYAKDAALMRATETDDVHTSTAAVMFRKKPEDVTKEERRMAKASNFTLIFGGGVNALVSNSILSGATMTYPEATELKTLFYRSFPGVAEMISKAQLLSQRRVVQIALPNGAKRVLTGQNNRPTVIINTLIQGSAAVGFKYALHHLRYQNKLDYIGCVVHDELVAAVPEVEVKEYSDIMDKAMHKGMQVALPGMIVKTEVKVGRSWS